MFDRINQYRSLWVWVFFDLPTETRKDRKEASEFRKKLLKDGFDMFQFSIYLRFCASQENAKVHTKRVKSILPNKGKVCIMQITDRQYGMIEMYFGQNKMPTKTITKQLELF